MASAMRRIGEYLGLVEDVEGYDQASDYGEPRHGQRRAPQEAGLTASVAAKPQAAAPVSDLGERRRGRDADKDIGAAPVSSVAELSRITTVHPRTYNEARTVGEEYRAGTPVIMNLTEMSDEDAKRLVDFAAGLVFASHGAIERITNKVFLLSPPNVSVTAEDKERIVEGGFFNQS